MKPTLRPEFLAILSGVVFCLATAAFASSNEPGEAEEALRRIRHLGYGMDSDVIRQLPQIESELQAPLVRESAKVVEVVVETTDRSTAIEEPNCRHYNVRLPYRMKKGGPLRWLNLRMAVPARQTEFNSRGAPYPALIVAPTIEGPTILENLFITNFSCNSGYVALVPQEIDLEVPEQLPDFQMYDRITRTEIIRTRRMIDFLQSRAEIDGERIGFVGFSRGAILGGLLMGIEPRIKAAYLGVGGMGMAEIIARSQTEFGQQQAQMQMSAAGIDADTYLITLRRAIRYEGLLFAHRVNPESVRLLISNQDDAVPTANQILMRAAMGEPEADIVETSHVRSIIRQSILGFGTVLRFFDGRFRP